MKIKELWIYNFQSIKKLELKDIPEQCFIGIMGSNSIGKTSIVRALEILFCNNVTRGLTEYVRDGELNFEVGIRSHCGYTIRTVRGNTQNFYEMTTPDGQTFKETRLERTVPDEIKKVMNIYFDPVTKSTLNIRTGDNGLIMVDTGPSENYSIFQTATGTTEIKSILDTINAKINADREVLRNLEYDMQNVAEELNSLVILDLTDINRSVEIIDELYEKSVDLERLIENKSKLESLVINPFDTKFFLGLIKTIEEKIRKSVAISNVCDKVERASSIKVGPNDINILDSNNRQLSEVYDRLKYLDILITKAEKASSIKVSNEDINTFFNQKKEILKFEDKLNDIAILMDKIRKKNIVSYQVSELRKVENISFDDTLERQVEIDKILSTAAELVKVKKAMLTAEEQLKAIRGEFDKLFEDAGFCEDCKEIAKQFNSISN